MSWPTLFLGVLLAVGLAASPLAARLARSWRYRRDMRLRRKLLRRWLGR